MFVTDEMKNHPRWKQLTARVDKDGASEDYEIETFVVHPMANFAPTQYGHVVDHENKFVGVRIDTGALDYEVRIPFEVVEQMMAWIKAGPRPK